MQDYVPEVEMSGDVLPAAKAVYEGQQQRAHTQTLCGALTVTISGKGLRLGLKPCTPGTARTQGTNNQCLQAALNGTG
jgi:hypothetical protein